MIWTLGWTWPPSPGLLHLPLGHCGLGHGWWDSRPAPCGSTSAVGSHTTSVPADPAGCTARSPVLFASHVTTRLSPAIHDFLCSTHHHSQKLYTGLKKRQVETQDTFSQVELVDRRIMFHLVFPLPLLFHTRRPTGNRTKQNFIC